MNIKEQMAFTHLVGKWIEFGALTNPLRLDQSKTSVKYADRLSKADAIKLFPELKEVADSIVDSELLIDFNQDDFITLNENDFDFLIANHFIEHLVNPIRFLEILSRAMKPKALLFLTVPDKDFTFDQKRTLTSNEHLWNDYLNKETEISDSHIKDFLLHKAIVAKPHPEIISYFKKNRLPISYYSGNRLPLNPFTRRRLYNFHRERSIHVHVWNRESFDGFLNWINSKLELGFSCLRTHNPDDIEGEMIYILQKI